MNSTLIFHQLFDSESSTYTYLLADRETREAVLIDPVREKAERDLQLLKELGLKLKYALDTHLHADHVTGAGALRLKTGAQTGMAAAAKVECADLQLKDGDELRFGKQTLKVISTPGHTDSCLSFYVDGKVFTGDSLMIRAAGRTDFQEGSPQRLYSSITEKLFKLAPETELYPGHDYKGHGKSTIADEMAHNARIGGGKTEFEFVSIMNGLNLTPPKKIGEALPANRKCGVL